MNATPDTHGSDRCIERRLVAQPSQDGDGVKIKRLHDFGGGLDPFLMLDRIDSDDPDSYIAGFPNHPHRGFENVTIMLEGLMRHQDSVGNDGLLRPGDVPWMTAGRGMLHEEMWDVRSGLLQRTFRGHVHAISEMCTSPCNTWLASSSVDGTVRVWQLSTGASEAVFEAKSSASRTA